MGQKPDCCDQEEDGIFAKPIQDGKWQQQGKDCPQRIWKLAKGQQNLDVLFELQQAEINQYRKRTSQQSQ